MNFAGGIDRELLAVGEKLHNTISIAQSLVHQVIVREASPFFRLLLFLVVL